MLSFHVKFVQTDRQMDRRWTAKQYVPDLSIWGSKNVELSKLKAFYRQHYLDMAQIMWLSFNPLPDDKFYSRNWKSLQTTISNLTKMEESYPNW